MLLKHGLPSSVHFLELEEPVEQKASGVRLRRKKVVWKEKTYEIGITGLRAPLMWLLTENPRHSGDVASYRQSTRGLRDKGAAHRRAGQRQQGEEEGTTRGRVLGL